MFQIKMEDTNPDQRPVDDYQVQRRRSTEILRHLTSSSVKRKKVKDSHCKFCLREKSALALVDHLRRSMHCSRLYMRIYKVNTLDNLLLKCFSLIAAALSLDASFSGNFAPSTF